MNTYHNILDGIMASAMVLGTTSGFMLVLHLIK